MVLLAEFDRRIPGLWEGVKANLLFPQGRGNQCSYVRSTTQCSASPELLSAVSLITKEHPEGPDLFLGLTAGAGGEKDY